MNANGEYIIELDQDDMFIRNDCFDILIIEGETNNLDLVHIRDFSKQKFLFNFHTKVNAIQDHLIYILKKLIIKFNLFLKIKCLQIIMFTFYGDY